MKLNGYVYKFEAPQAPLSGLNDSRVVVRSKDEDWAVVMVTHLPVLDLRTTRRIDGSEVRLYRTTTDWFACTSAALEED